MDVTDLSWDCNVKDNLLEFTGYVLTITLIMSPIAIGMGVGSKVLIKPYQQK